MNTLFRLAIALAGVVALGGCGGGSSSSNPPAASSGAATLAPAAPAVPAAQAQSTPAVNPAPVASTPNTSPANVVSPPVSAPPAAATAATPVASTAAAAPNVARVDMAGLTNFVNVFIGTGATDTGLSGAGGNVNPGAQAPFGMVNFGPDTPANAVTSGPGSAGYLYSDSSIDFFSLTHLNGVGCRGQGGVVMRPGTAEITFSHANESAQPGYYSVKADSGILSELTATTRTGMARLTFPAGTAPMVIVDTRGAGSLKTGAPTDQVDLSLDTQANAVSGHTVVGAYCNGRWYKPVSFYMVFDTPIDATATKTYSGMVELAFKQNATGPTVIQLKAGISSVSTDNAKLNLTTENTDWSFDAVRRNQDAIWNRRLNTVQLDIAAPGAIGALSASQRQLATSYVTQFYTALYHTMMGPTVYSDVNGDYRSMQQTDLTAQANTVPVRKTVNVGQYAVPGAPAAYKTHYSGFSLWDSYRSLTQFQALLFPSEVSDMMQSLVADAVQCGAFPHSVDGSDDTAATEGDPAPNAIAGAYMFGARGFDTATARTYMLQSAFGTTPGGAFTAGRCNNVTSVPEGANTSYAQAAGRFYAQNGYVPTDTVPNAHAGSLTLEFQTTDESVGNFLSLLGNPQDSASIATLHSRASSWANLFNASIPASQQYFGVTSGLVPKNSTGQWDFSGTNNGGFLQATEPNYLWTAQHDYSALISKLGGDVLAMERLDTLFGLSPDYPFDGAMSSAQTLNSGAGGSTFYIGGKASMQAPWAYNWAVLPTVSQRVIPMIMQQTFRNDAGGLPGNDGMGALSGWYVWASLGLYPVIPSAPGLAMSTPQFGGATLWLGDGTKRLRIQTDDTALLNNKPYISSVKLNGQDWKGSWLPLAAIANGGTLTYTLSSTYTTWAGGTALTPPSGPAADYTQPYAQKTP
ncbi:GH92 family glycosyl hydrolase [Caballeronia sp. LZ035]|uniref:GH92 family glycosyl hydrolase n=1 Tax=Caballeronia sp. LZ035 TaxID=3038568 RepID=UPI0028584930|nr:GH92 family glycosyl hydrolase [Caballeronia sp. LZ035]MDR5761752.1 GH92 family glycosyl hydrolase [Caballeronia sp. LZ035]